MDNASPGDDDAAIGGGFDVLVDHQNGDAAGPQPTNGGPYLVSG